MQHLEVSGAVRPLNLSLGVKWLTIKLLLSPYLRLKRRKEIALQVLTEILYAVLLSSINAQLMFFFLI